MENWEKFLKEAECPPGCEPAQGPAGSAAGAPAVSDGSIEQTLQTISRKDNARLRAFLSLVLAAGYPRKVLSALLSQFGVTDTAILDNLPQATDLPGTLPKLVQAAASRPHIATFIRDQVKELFKAYQKNPQLIISTT